MPHSGGFSMITMSNNRYVDHGYSTQATIYEQVIDVKPYTTYNFSMWVYDFKNYMSGVAPDYPSTYQYSGYIEFDSPLKQVTWTGGDEVWKEITTTWTSGASRSLTLKIVHYHPPFSGTFVYSGG